jgi:hypothetical protein
MLAGLADEPALPASLTARLLALPPRTATRCACRPLVRCGR